MVKPNEPIRGEYSFWNISTITAVAAVCISLAVYLYIKDYTMNEVMFKLGAEQLTFQNTKVPISDAAIKLVQQYNESVTALKKEFANEASKLQDNYNNRYVMLVNLTNQKIAESFK
jgi:hypothetical protein